MYLILNNTHMIEINVYFASGTIWCAHGPVNLMLTTSHRDKIGILHYVILSLGHIKKYNGEEYVSSGAIYKLDSYVNLF